MKCDFFSFTRGWKNVPYTWKDIVDQLQGFKPKLFYCVVRWKPPDHHWVKCNTDGACRGNPGISSYGFCIRDHCGNLIYAESKNIGVSTNMVAEMSTIREAIKYCRHMGLQQVLVETDSLSSKNILSGNWRIPWEIAEIVEDIIDLSKSSNIIFKHIFREGNQLADFITNLAIQQEGKHQFSSFQQLPSYARRILNTDKYQLPSLRIKTQNISSYNNYTYATDQHDQD